MAVRPQWRQHRAQRPQSANGAGFRNCLQAQGGGCRPQMQAGRAFADVYTNGGNGGRFMALSALKIDTSEMQAGRRFQSVRKNCNVEQGAVGSVRNAGGAGVSACRDGAQAAMSARPQMQQ